MEKMVAREGQGPLRVYATIVLLVLLGSLVLAAHAGAFGLLNRIGSVGTGDGQFTDMYGVTTDPAGNVWAPDNDGERLEKFGPDGAFLFAVGFGVQDGSPVFQKCTSGCQVGIAGSGDGQFDGPRYAAADSSGRVYVTDTGNNRVEVFDRNGNFLRKWGSAGVDAGQFDGPSGIDITVDRHVIVVDRNNNRVQRFTLTGGAPTTLGWGVKDGSAALQTCSSGCQAGIPGAGAGQLSDPTDLRADAASSFYVADSGDDRVVQFSARLKLLRQFGATGTGAGQLRGPRGVAVAPNGEVLVLEGENDRVSRFGPTGAFKSMFGWGVKDGSAALQVCTAGCQAGIAGTGLGQLQSEESLAVDCGGRVFVPDFSLTAMWVQVFGEPGAGTCPNRALGFGKLKRKKRRGIALLTVRIHAPGTVKLTGRGVRRRVVRKQPPSALAFTRAVKLKVAARGGKLRKLRDDGKVRLRVKVTFHPALGKAKSRRRVVTLVRR
jgi:DNA-binding beta-propeller fold protein YncE